MSEEQLKEMLNITIERANDFSKKNPNVNYDELLTCLFNKAEEKIQTNDYPLGIIHSDKDIKEFLNKKNNKMNTKKQTMENIEGNNPFEKWENLKKYILTQVDIIDREVPWSNTEPEWWLEMQEIDMKIRAITNIGNAC